MSDLLERAKSNSALVYLPGDPRSTNFIKQMMLIAALIARDTTMFITATHWRAIQAELDAQYMDALLDPTGPVPWREADHFNIGKPPNQLHVVNARTDDQLAVNRMNYQTPGAVDFIARRDKLRIV